MAGAGSVGVIPPLSHWCRKSGGGWSLLPKYAHRGTLVTQVRRHRNLLRNVGTWAGLGGTFILHIRTAIGKRHCDH